MYKGVGVCFADFISFFLKKTHENEIILSHSSEPPLDGGGGGGQGGRFE